MSARTPSTFLQVSAGVGILGCLLAAAIPPAVGASAAFTGSIVASGVLGLVFSGRNLQLLREHGRVSLPAAVLTTIFGGWFMLAPLLYDPGFLATAGVQTAGMLVSTFVLYVVVAGLAGGEY